MKLRFRAGRTSKERFVLRHKTPFSDPDIEFINSEVYTIDSISIEVNGNNWAYPTEIAMVQREVVYGNKTYDATEFVITPPSDDLTAMVDDVLFDAEIILNGEFIESAEVIVE
ncbi:hypothetical protein Q4575_05270 [Psychrosphaera sp. 1_MG-2023]|uniref:hypothetical protein n=1 Tax=Psychrosphaera sp. 1_MG-2023 TaxID=3062643 RepID=UPI0026E1CCB0|nr:hypothetical protein [Psychrosphaera sp. 1_MG-2023]MDO6718800.1 hypothetical protein [Psychrosphaera sp. 1_MG-2023]